MKSRHTCPPSPDTSVMSTGSLFQSRPFQLDINNNQQIPNVQKESDAFRGGWDLTQKQWDFSKPPVAPNMGSPLLQAKLTIGEPNDKYEQEADQVAEKSKGNGVNDTSDHKKSPKVSSLLIQPLHPLQRAAKREQQEQALQMKPLSLLQQAKEQNSTASANIEKGVNNARGKGQSLAPRLQTQMGQAMQADFSSVRIHTGTQADQLNKSVQARAFTTGKDVFFKYGEYQPNNREGQELIAHELTHVLQQKSLRNSEATKIQRKITLKNGQDNADLTDVAVALAEKYQSLGGVTLEKAQKAFSRTGNRVLAKFIKEKLEEITTLSKDYGTYDINNSDELKKLAECICEPIADEKSKQTESTESLNTLKQEVKLTNEKSDLVPVLGSNQFKIKKAISVGQIKRLMNDWMQYVDDKTKSMKKNNDSRLKDEDRMKNFDNSKSMAKTVLEAIEKIEKEKPSDFNEKVRIAENPKATGSRYKVAAVLIFSSYSNGSIYIDDVVANPRSILSASIKDRGNRQSKRLLIKGGGNALLTNAVIKSKKNGIKLWPLTDDTRKVYLKMKYGNEPAFIPDPEESKKTENDRHLVTNPSASEDIKKQWESTIISEE